MALVLSPLVGGTGKIRAESPLFDPARVRWSQLNLRASKLAVTATSEVEIRTEPVSRVVGRWLGSSAGRPLMPEGSEVVRIELRSQVLGKSSELDLWVDRVSGAAIQRTQLETGKKVRHNRHRSLRFTDTGVFNSTYRATDDTVERPHTEWALSESFKPHPESLELGIAVTEPSALFYLLAVADLDQDGDRVVTFVYSKNRILRVELVVQGTTEIGVDYTEITDAGERNVEGRQEVVRIRLDGSPVGEQGSEVDFEFLSLRGDVEIFLEPNLRIPLQISGKIRYVGQGHVRLQRVRLK